MSRLMTAVGIPVGKLHRFQNRPERLWANPVDVIADFAGVTATAAATAHVMGAWVQLLAATTGEVDTISLHLYGVGATTADTRQLVDIGIGALGAETVIVSSLPSGFIAFDEFTRGIPGLIRFPLSIPKGTRISARMQAIIVSDTVSVVLNTYNSGLRTGSRVDTYGADTATSAGTNLPTTDVYVQLTAATTQPYQALVLLPTGTGSAFANGNTTHTLASGAAGAEIPLITQIVQTAAAETLRENNPPTIFAGHVPLGTRLAVKTSLGNTVRGAIVLGIRY